MARITHNALGYSVLTLALAASTGCSGASPLDPPLAFLRPCAIEANGTFGQRDLETVTAPPAVERSGAAPVEAVVRMWSVEWAEIERLGNADLSSLCGHVLDAASADRAASALDERTPAHRRSEARLWIEGPGSASLEVVRQVSMLSSWEVRGMQHALIADPVIDIANFGTRVDVEAASADASDPIDVALRIELAEPSGEFARIDRPLLGLSPVSIEIPLITRFEISAHEALRGGEAMLLVAPELSDDRRGRAILVTARVMSGEEAGDRKGPPAAALAGVGR